MKCEKTVDLSLFNRSLHHTNMQESYVNSYIASMQTSLESIQTHAEWGSTKTGKTVQSQWCLFFALCPSIWAQFYIAPKHWMSGHFELWGQDWIRQKPQQSPMRMVRRERETVVRRKSLFMNRRSQKWPVWGWGGRENKRRIGCFLFFILPLWKK